MQVQIPTKTFCNFMEKVLAKNKHGISSLRDIEKLCRNDIRYMYLLDEMKAPSFATFGNFIRNELTDSIEQIFNDLNKYIFEQDHVDLDHTYIDGTKMEANANRYTWVWKKSCIENLRPLSIFNKVFVKRVFKRKAFEDSRI